MIIETKKIKVDSYALEHQQQEIANAIIELINNKLAVMKKFHKFKLTYRINPDLHQKTNMPDKYVINFLNCDTKETIELLEIVFEKIEENNNDKQQEV